MTRNQQVEKLLARKRGVSLEEIVSAFGVQRHSARALISIARRTFKVERVDGRYYTAR